ncbi:PKD domain-containing protein [Roseivirga sp.]|uniref:PKD domain-containing protein n=1 Tax=Roseivirga sp. TaxID=1964215 RepID=UPI003B8DFE45
MKNLNKFLILTLIALVFSCKDDEAPAVIPTTLFTQDRDFIESNEDITFSNNSTDAVSYSWNFGDNSALSTDENPVHTYTSTGDFTVTLTATSETGDQSTSTRSVTVGERWVVALGINAIPFTDQNGDPWDEDNSGPDLLFGFAKADAETFLPYNITDGLDIQPSDIPTGGTLPPANQEVLTDEDWAFIFIDNDEPLDDLNQSTIMASFLVNPVTVTSEKDYSDGTGTFVFESLGFSFIIAFEIRN